MVLCLEPTLPLCFLMCEIITSLPGSQCGPGFFSLFLEVPIPHMAWSIFPELKSNCASPCLRLLGAPSPLQGQPLFPGGLVAPWVQGVFHCGLGSTHTGSLTVPELPGHTSAPGALLWLLP